MTRAILTFFVLILFVSPALAQSSPEPDSAKAAAPKKPAFALKITDDPIAGFSLKAKDAKLSEIAGAIKGKLKIPVTLSPLMAKQTVTMDFADLLLEPAMQLLAPVVYIDYEIATAPGVMPRPVGIYLQAHNEIAPALNAVVQNKSQVFAISGNTEEVDEAELPVVVNYKDRLLSVRAKDQPLIEVLSDIATETNIPLETENPDSTETVSINVKDVPIEQALLQLSPHLRLYLRADLFRNERTPLLIVLVDGEKKS
jgi:type II secretory pathway component GspD/PulD (secretin)